MKRLVVLGGGESGVGTAILASQKGYDVFLSDKNVIKEKYKSTLDEYHIDYEEQKHSEDKILNADVVMKSPGIPDVAPLVQKLLDKRVSVISEIEFAARYTNAVIIGITGSNGKTTTTMLAYHILKSAGFNVGIAGNIGDSFAKQVATENFDYYVLELSSFQLDGIDSFKPDIAVITNITPDHLDRYDYSFDNYIDSKFRIIKNQTKDECLIYDADDEVISDWLKENKTAATLIPFSLKKELEYGAYIEEDKIVIKNNKELFRMNKSELGIKGEHNVKNSMAAALIASRRGIRNKSVAASLTNFEGAEHRLEKVKTINDVLYVNDSKATNVNAAYYALGTFEKPIIWIVGGVDKGNDYTDLMPLVREKVKAIICLGLDNEKIISSFGNVIDDIFEVDTALAAVKQAYKLSKEGDTVLLAPACASFDLFDSYEDRGRQFKEAVKSL